MSSLASTPSKGGPYRKPRADVFTFLLVLSLIAVSLGTVCLYFEMKRFNFDFRKDVPPPPPPLQAMVVPGGLALGDYLPQAV